MKHLFCLLLAISLPLFSSAQQLYLGARLDASAMKWTFSDQYRVPVEYPFSDADIAPLWGFQMSFPIEYRLNKWLGLQTEIGFAKRGFALKLSGNEQGCDIDATAKSTFRYFDFPLLLKTYLTHGKGEFYLLAGPSYSKIRNAKIHVRATVSCGGETESDSDSEPIDLDDYPGTHTDHGIYAGLGFSKGSDRYRFFFEGRYFHGLKKQSEEGAQETIYNRGVLFSMGFVFGLLRK